MISEARNFKGSHIVNILRKNPRTITLEEITLEEAEGKTLLGQAGGVDLNHCVLMGARYCEDFLDKVRFYYISEAKLISPQKKNYILVNFYY